MKAAPRRPLVALAICAGIALAFLAAYRARMRPLPELEAFVQDLQTRFGRKTPVDERLVLIGVDKPAYLADFSDEEIQREPVLGEMRRTFPWSRAVWARLIEKLAAAGAKVIVFDFVFAAPGEGDEALAAAIEKHRDRVVLGYNLNQTRTDRGGVLTEMQIPNGTVFTPAAGVSPLEDDRLGYVTIWPDADDVIRRAQYRMSGDQAGDVAAPEVRLESLAARAVRKFGRPELIPPGTNSLPFRYTGPPGFGFRPHPIGDVLSPKLWASNYGGGKFFAGKIVLVGPTAEIFHDVHPTPFAGGHRQMPGPELHLNLINAALHGEFLSEPGRSARLAIIFLAGGAAAALSLWLRQPFKRLGVLSLLTGAYALVAWKFFDRAGGSAQIILIATPALVLLFSGIGTLAYDYFQERREKRRIRRTLERYVSKDVVKEVLDNPESYLNSLSGVRKPVTILFSDVRGFTTLTESADSAALVRQLNEYFEEMVRVVFAHQGRLDKFIGDAVMADWGSIVTAGPALDAQRAVAAALAMRAALLRLNQSWRARGMIELAFGLGLNHGEVILGNLGSEEKMEVSVIGDAVNLASRLEGLTKEYHLDLLLGETIAPLVREKFLLQLVDCVQVKGKTKPVDVFTVVGDMVPASPLPPWLAFYEDGVKLYRARQFAEAAAAFEKSLQFQNDQLTEMYLKRCRELMQNPPDSSWNGVFVMTKK